MAWQRRIVEFPEVESLIDHEPGDMICWITKRIVECPNCGRPGAEFKDGVVHATDDERHALDACFDNVGEGEAPVLILDQAGNVIEERDSSLGEN